MLRLDTQNPSFILCIGFIGTAVGYKFKCTTYYLKTKKWIKNIKSIDIFLKIIYHYNEILQK